MNTGLCCDQVINSRCGNQKNNFSKTNKQKNLFILIEHSNCTYNSFIFLSVFTYILSDNLL